VREDCVFCRIVARTEPATLVRTNERVVAFLAIPPATRGHTLVVPRRHARNLFDIDGVDLEAVAHTAQEIALWQRERLGCSGVTLFQANEPAGFQSVFHYHVHVVPRYPDDGVRPAWAGLPNVSVTDLEPVARELRGGVDLDALTESRGTPTHGLGAASVILDDSGRVLLVRHTYGRRNWEIPGGISEEGESAEETARREAREEIDAELEIEALAGVYWEPSWNGIGGHHFVFRARLVRGSVAARADTSEIAEVGWFRVEQLPRPISDFTIRRISDALAAGPALVRLVGPRTWLE
jgi:diadenosine tetraphosphate (Ap4A) HIT family hydrolase/ADP-ribose pyrophosphatase YjhB (NUDIX family)